MTFAIPSTDWITLALTAAAGIGIASACGLRAFLPLLALSLGARAGLVAISPASAWLASDAALWTLGFAALAEVLADKVPVVDHALDAAATAVRPAAAALAAWATFGTLHPALALFAAVVLGSGALGLHALKAKARLGSTLLSLGAANPVLSTLEDVMAGALSALSILLPVVALGAIALGGVLLVRKASARA